jgi:hypothetical protein
MEEKFTAMEAQLTRDAPADDATAREKALAAEQASIDAKAAAIASEREQIRNGAWTGPTVPLSPTSIFVAPPTAVMQPGPPKQPQPRFTPNDLPQILFGNDFEEWLSEMDHIVSSFGETVVCPHILPRCFVQGDPIRDWYLTKPSATHSMVTTGEGCWERFKLLLRSRFKPDLGVLQYEAESYRRQPGESWAAYGIHKYRLLKRAYAEADEATIILMLKAKMDTEVVRFCKEKYSIDQFVGELMDFDRTSPATLRTSRSSPLGDLGSPGPSGGSSYRPPYQAPPGQPPYSSPRPGREKGKGAVKDDRKNSIRDRINPDTGKLCRSYLNYQMKPVFIQRACKICDKNGRPNQMHFTFECTDTSAKTLAIDAAERDDVLADDLHRTESGHLTSYNFQHGMTHTGAIYHEEDDDLDATSEWGNSHGGW